MLPEFEESLPDEPELVEPEPEPELVALPDSTGLHQFMAEPDATALPPEDAVAEGLL